MDNFDEKAKKANLLIDLATSFGKQYPERVFELWLRNIEDVSFADLQSGIDHLVKSSRFMPTIADIREAASEHYAKIDDEFRLNPKISQQQLAEFLDKQERYAD